MQTLSDRELVERARSGSHDAFGALVERYQDPLFRYARHMGFAEADARDILQDAFIRAFRHLDRCSDPDRFDGWLFKITANLCRTAASKGANRDEHGLEEVMLLETNPDPETAAEASSRRRRIRAALAELPEDQRQATVLFYLEGYGVKEIAERAEASPSAIKMRLKRARESLKAALRPLEDEVRSA
ncbi:MAG: sigma-70 family RNA polymerase sigma factor [Gemmatimonadales bacterium]|jgi:RNA polymerase sigma-70 factor (ECF subfamily)|nr:MAG: sigma-70 family RNA polymerase sigma factor [Gemmatimonadales bacterium]